jgi:hypothetical protein
MKRELKMITVRKKSSFLRFLDPKDIYSLITQICFLNNKNKKVFKRNEIEVKDVEIADIVSYQNSTENASGECFIKFFTQDFDRHGKNGNLTEIECIENAKRLWEILGKPTPSVIQRSKNGEGVHFLCLAECEKPVYSRVFKDGLSSGWRYYKPYETIYKTLSEKYGTDVSMKNAVHAIDLEANGKLFPLAFEIVEIIENNGIVKPIVINDDLAEKVVQYFKRTKDIYDIERVVLRAISYLGACKENRNNCLYSTVADVFKYSHIPGFNESKMEGLIQDACVKNGYIQEHGMGDFKSTFISGKKKGKSNLTNLEDGFILTPERDILYDPESTYEADLMREVLNKLGKEFYYLKDAKSFYNKENGEYYNIESVMAQSKIRFFKEVEVKKQVERKRLTNYDNIIKNALKYPVEILGWERSLEKIITRPCYNGNEIIYQSGHTQDVLAEIPEIKNSKIKSIDDFLKGYSFVSVRSKVYALIAMIAAFGSEYWGWRKPAFYFTASSQEGRDSGKTTLARIIGFIRSDKIASFALDDDERKINKEEIKKTMLPKIKTGARTILIDNLPSDASEFKWSELDSWLTQKTWSARVLGSSECYETENNILYIMTGNLVGLSEDLMSRSCVIVFSDKYKGSGEYAENPDQEMLGLELSFKIKKLFEKWILTGKPRAKISDVDKYVTSRNKFPDFWQDALGILKINNIDISFPDQVELECYQNGATSYDELIEFFAKRQYLEFLTAKDLIQKEYEDLEKRFKIGGKNSSFKLGKILSDLHKKYPDRVLRFIGSHNISSYSFPKKERED